MEDLRAFGRVSKEVKGSDPAEAAARGLAGRLCTAKATGFFTDEHDLQLAGMSDELVQIDQLMEDLLALG